MIRAKNSNDGSIFLSLEENHMTPKESTVRTKYHNRKYQKNQVFCR